MKVQESYPSDFADGKLRSRVKTMYEDLHMATLASRRTENCRERLLEAAAALQKLLEEVLV